MNTFRSEDIEINRYRELETANEPLEASYLKSPKLSISSNSATDIISNLNRCQLSNLWYFTNLLSENFSPISIGDCFRFRFIKLDSNQPTNAEEEQSVSLEDSFNDGLIMKKTYNILTAPRIFNRNQELSIMEMLKLNTFNIFNGTLNIDCFSEPLTISKSISTHIIDSQLGAFLNCLMISSVELIHGTPNVAYAIYSPEELKSNPPLLSMSDSVDLNFFNPYSENQTKFVNPISKTELNYSDAIRLNYIDDSLSEISFIDSLDNEAHLTTRHAIKKNIFDPEFGTIYAHHLKSTIALHYARQEGILSKPSTILQLVLEKNESSFLSDLKNQNCSFSEAIKRGIIDGNSEFSIKPNYGQKISLSDAINRGIVTNQGKLSVDNTEISFLDAFNKGLIKLNENIISGPNNDITHPSQNQKLTLPEAIHEGIIDPKTETFININTGERLSLKEAYDNKWISKSLLRDLSVYCGIKNQKNLKLNILQAVSENLINLPKGLILDHSNSQWVPINEAFHRKMITKNQYNRFIFLTCPLIKFSISIDDIAINIDQTEGSLFENRKLYQAITGVYDPLAKGYTTLEEAQNRHIIDNDLGVYYDEKNNVYYSFNDAIEENLIQTSTEKTSEKIIEIKAIKSEKTKSFTISSVFNSITNEWISARQAVEDGIIDQLSGNYKVINEFGYEIDMPINEAVSSGFIKATDEEESLINDEFKIIGFKNPISGEILTPMEAIEQGLVDRKFEKFYMTDTHQIISINEASELGFVIMENLDSDVHPKTWTLNELITAALIDFDSGLISYANNDIVVSLNDAINLGQIDIDRSVLKHPDNGRHINLREAINSGLFDPIRCEIKDDYDNIITLTDAITEDLFPEHVPTERGKITFEEALEQGYINLKTNVFRDPRNNVEYPVEEAIVKNVLDHPQSSMSVYMTDRSRVIENKILEIPNEEGFIDTKMVKTSESIKRDYRVEHIDYEDIKSVRDTLTDQEISLPSAIDKGIIKVYDNTFVDHRSGRTMPIDMAFKLGLISNTNVVEDSSFSNVTSLTGSTNENNNTPRDFYIIDPNTGKKLSMNQAIKEKIYDPVDKMIRSRTNNNFYSWEDSIKLGFIIDESRNTLQEEKIMQRNCIVYNFYYVHKGVDVIAKLTDQMIEENQIDPINHTIKDPKTGKCISLLDGLENGSVFAAIITLTNKSLYFENLNKRHDNYQIISVYDSSVNQLISYQEAINKKIIDIMDSTYTNLKSKEISTLSEALQHGLLHTVMKTRQFVPLSYPFNNVHIRTVEEEMNFSIPENIPEDVITPERKIESKKFEELSNTMIPTMIESERQKEKALKTIYDEHSPEIATVIKLFLDKIFTESVSIFIGYGNYFVRIYPSIIML